VEDYREKIVGGGILPVSVDEMGNIYILLGKERYINHWRGSLKWSGFEGGKKCDESIEHLSSREFIEESMGVVSFDDQTNESTINTVMEKINYKEYFARILLCIEHNETSEIESRYHITYVFQVPYEKKCIERFDNLRNFFIEFQSKLIAFRKLIDQIPNEIPFIREDTIIMGTKVKALIDVSVVKNELIVTYLEEEGIKKIKRDISTDNDTVSLYLRWYSFREELNNDVKHFKKLSNSLQIQRNCLGFFIDARINEEYIEKQEIKWWSIKELRKVLKNGGFLNQDYFRAYFLPVLQRTIEELEKYENRDNNSN
tara:strand:+ start:604 stop:1545 length:942 start_codon:yes stop_codon:yes gene_type:complete